MLRSSGMHMILPHSMEEEAEIQSSKMIFAQGNAAVRVGGLQPFPAPQPALLLLNHTWVDRYK